MERYLITGFSGFVGYYFISHLNQKVSEKTEVLGLDVVEPFDFEKWNFPNLIIQFKAVNMLDNENLYKIINKFKPTHVLHLAALSSVGKSWQEPAECFLNNTGIFLNIAEVIRKEQLNAKLLCIGSSEEYGFVNQNDIPIRETLYINPASPYAVTKVAQEGMSRCYVDKFGMKIMLTRSFNHIGPRQRDTFVIASFTKQVAQAFVEGKKNLVMSIGNFSVIRDFLDVRDVVAAYYLILQDGKPGEIYNVCSGNGYELKSIIQRLSKISGIEITTETNPAYMRPNDMPIIIGNNNKLKKDTGWEPVYSIEQSLKDIFDYWVKTLQEN